MGWTKKGLIFQPDSQYTWMQSHCQLPVANILDNGNCRVYFASRTKEQISNIGYADIDLYDNFRIIRVSENPILSPGPIGNFDQFGVYPASIVNLKNKIYLYYIGWIRGYFSPLFYAAIGLAISEDRGNSFKKYSNVPIMERSKYDPCLVTSPNVFIDDNGQWKMTYVSGIKWETVGKELLSYYHIKYAESNDGINWQREGRVAIDFKDVNERNIARSAVYKKNGKYEMYYSFVSGDLSYRIGYAKSLDCINWVREDANAGIDVTENSFDSEMMCYPNIVIHNNKKYMFYNGNNYGKEGFGVAVSEI